MGDEEGRDRSRIPAARAAALNALVLRSIVDHAIVTLDADGTVVSWNHGAEKILGWSEEEMVGQPVGTFFTPEDVKRDRPAREMRRALEDGRADDERWHRRKDGSRFWASGLMMPLLTATNAEGEAVQGDGVGGFVKIFRDRTTAHRFDGDGMAITDQAVRAMARTDTVGVFDNDLLGDVVLADDTCAALHRVPIEVARLGAPAERFFDGVHPEDADMVRNAVERARREGASLDVTYRIASDSPRPRWAHAQGGVRRDTDGRPARLSGIVMDVTALREESRMRDARLEFAERVRDMSDLEEIAGLASRVIAETLYATRAGHGELERDGDVIDIRTDHACKGHRSVVGRLRFSDFGSFASVLRDGEMVAITDARADDRVPDPGPLESIGARALVNLPLMERGRLKAVLFVNDDRPRDWTSEEIAFLRAMSDRTYAAIDRARSEIERATLSDEMAHRMKNMLTITQVIVTQTLRRAGVADAVRDRIGARLGALGAAQDVLVRRDHDDADIHDVAQAALAPHMIAGRLTVDGPPLTLEPQRVLGLTLGLHELATNAAKHGALSQDGGRVDLRWSHDGGAFRLQWTERGGPTVEPPASSGFGTQILTRVVGGYFDGDSTVDYDPAGITFRIEGTLA